jgi:hypothetical protein
MKKENSKDAWALICNGRIETTRGSGMVINFLFFHGREELFEYAGSFSRITWISKESEKGSKGERRFKERRLP